MNKPVAWINIEDGNSILDWEKDEYAQKHYPLYTHPVELTDEEIHKEFLELVKDCDPMLSIASVGFPDLIADFAKAILRKAQEK